LQVTSDCMHCTVVQLQLTSRHVAALFHSLNQLSNGLDLSSAAADQ